MILMIYTSFSSFVKVDYEILSSKYDIKRYQYINTKSLSLHISNQIKMFFWIILNIYKSDSLYIWFADYHSFIPILLSKIFGKKSFLVLGGYDVTYIPEYNYGSFNNPIRAFCARYAMKNATFNLAVSDNIKIDALKYAPTANIKIVYTGYSHIKFPFSTEKNKNEILSVCEATTLQRAYIKGADLLLKVAQLLPELKFTIVALDEQLAKNNFNVPSNVTLISRLNQLELIDYYQRAVVYTQLSIREGLPNSVCEAMLCGCIPVGTNCGGIPIAIGDTGYISKNREPNEISRLIRDAINKSAGKNMLARKRIINNFSLELRSEKLLTMLEEK